MWLVVSLGGNALLKRGEPMTADRPSPQNVRVQPRPRSLPLASQHDPLVLSHGNGPQVGLLALQAAAYTEVEAYPLDVLGAQTEGMIGYVLEQELGNVLPKDAALASLLTMIEVDPADHAFSDPTKTSDRCTRRTSSRRAGRRRGHGSSSRTALRGDAP